MQRGRPGMDDFFGFGDPFANFEAFGRPGSMISSFFGGRDPFDDPFFTRPFGGMMGPSFFGRSMFGAGGSPFGNPVNVGFLEDQAPQPNTSKGPIIEELFSDDEVEEQGKEGPEKKDSSRKHSRSSNEPYVQDPDEEIGEKKSRRMLQRVEYKRPNMPQPQNSAYSFHSSTVTYGGFNGAYYSSSTARRTRGDGVQVEESREADTTTGKATHRISRGIGQKGHSITRKLNSDGRVDTMQTLHNLNEDELAGFEESWKGNAGEHLPGWNMLSGGIRGVRLRTSSLSQEGASNAQSGGQSSKGWVLPTVEPPQYAGPSSPEARAPCGNFSDGKN